MGEVPLYTITASVADGFSDEDFYLKGKARIWP